MINIESISCSISFEPGYANNIIYLLSDLIKDINSKLLTIKKCLFFQLLKSMVFLVTSTFSFNTTAKLFFTK